MTRYLLDTTVVSVLAPARRAANDVDRALLAWLMRREPETTLSVVTVMEIESGVQQLARAGSTRRQAELAGWLVALEERRLPAPA